MYPGSSGFLIARRRRRLRASLATLAAFALLAIPAVALASSIKVVATFPKSNPVAGKPWPIELKVTDGKQKLSGKVHYNFLFDGAQVSSQPGKKIKDGVYKDKLTFPKKAIGITLTLQVVVVTPKGTKDVDHTVTTKS